MAILVEERPLHLTDAAVRTIRKHLDRVRGEWKSTMGCNGKVYETAYPHSTKLKHTRGGRMTSKPTVVRV